MKINLSPMRCEQALSLSKSGRVLNINGENFDFSQMNDGDTLPSSAINSEWFVGDVRQESGEIEITLMLPLPANFSAEQLFPIPLVITADGPVALPQPLPIPEPAVEPEA